MGLCLSGNEARFFAQPPLQYWRLTRRVSFTRKPVNAFDWGGLCSVHRVCDVRRHHRPPLRRVASRGSVIVDRYSCKGQAAEAKARSSWACVHARGDYRVAFVAFVALASQGPFTAVAKRFGGPPKRLPSAMRSAHANEGISAACLLLLLSSCRAGFGGFGGIFVELTG